MNHNFSTQFVDAPLSEPRPLSTEIPHRTAKNDSLIDQGGQHAVYFGAALFLLGIVAIVGIISRKVEHAIIAALVLSLLLIMFFFFIGH